MNEIPFEELLGTVASITLAIYGVLGIVRYGRHISKNTHLLTITFSLLALVPISDMLEHADYLPGEEFWKHVHMFVGIAAFYFMHRFVASIDAKEREDYKKSVIELVAAILFAIAFFTIEEIIEDNNPAMMALFLGAVSIIFLIFVVRLLSEIMAKSKKLESSFSLKSFAISMVPAISFMAFILMSTAIFAEFIEDVFKDGFGEQAAETLEAIHELFHILVTMSLAGFAYMAERIYNFYAPIEKFIQGRKKGIFPCPIFDLTCGIFPAAPPKKKKSAKK